LVGSLPGAIPPIIGTAAKLGYIDEMGWLLFALLFCWQIPHFMALAVMWREDYERGGLKITTVEDPSGRTASIWAMVFIVPMMLVIALIIQTFFGPHAEETYHGLTSPFLWIASISTLWFFKLALEFTSAERRAQVAKPFFLASILYLPVVLLTLTLNRLF
jgi:protoheme IX farnesyltransferase